MDRKYSLHLLSNMLSKSDTLRSRLSRHFQAYTKKVPYALIPYIY